MSTTTASSVKKYKLPNNRISTWLSKSPKFKNNTYSVLYPVLSYKPNHSALLGVKAP